MKEFNFQLTIHSISIGSIENASSFNIGRNFLRDFKSMSKSNAGIGSISGNHNSFPSSVNYVHDPDQMDMCWDTSDKKLEPRSSSNHKDPFARFSDQKSL
ncbi:MAG TPA: hypothetical protein DDW65_19865 [Firmicutes bacterium]|jgi:hypothetical protein|nr:hypothetical protein [Bacillota bacterium]